MSINPPLGAGKQSKSSLFAASKERLKGAGAIHACVRAGLVPGTGGWIELDPTNNIPAGADHIIDAYSHDHSDVAPVIGVLKDYGSQKTVQAVNVAPVKQ